MAELTEGRHAGEFILSVGNGHISFDNGMLAEGQNLEAGTVLGLVGGEWTQLAPGATSSEQDAAGILFAPVNATDAAQPCAVVVRQAEVNGKTLVWPDGISDPEKDAAIAQLAALGVIVR